MATYSRKKTQFRSCRAGISPKYIVMSENQRDCQGQADIEAIAQAE